MTTIAQTETELDVVEREAAAASLSLPELRAGSARPALDSSPAKARRGPSTTYWTCEATS